MWAVAGSGAASLGGWASGSRAESRSARSRRAPAAAQRARTVDVETAVMARSRLRCRPRSARLRAPPRALPSEALDAAVTGSASLGTALRVADVSVDAWSVGGGSALALFGERFAGIETKLFQAGLLPYLVYLYFLGKEETATPRASLFGARFLLLFVAATIPAGIVAKTSYGDILANVDVLHGSSETLLSVSNFLFAFGFYEALETSRKKNKNGDDDVFEASPETQTETETRLSSTTALLLLAALAGFGSYGAGHLIHSEPAMRFLTEQMHARAEPQNALSTQTWAVHVSSVTEWALAMRLVLQYASDEAVPKLDANENWRFLTLAMTPFLASGFAACTFHAFYNPPSINALVPLQALLTFLGNAGCAVAAFAVYRNGLDRSENDATRKTLVEEEGGGMAVSSIVTFASFVVLSSTACVVTPLIAGDFFFEPSYDKALAMIAAPTLVWAAFLFVTDVTVRSESKTSSKTSSSSNDRAVANESEQTKKSGFAQVKEFGTAGIASYVLVELAFWAIALPAAIAWYRVAEGTWLDFDNPADKAKLLGAGAVFINGVRFFVPFRLAAALALAPVVRRTFFDEAAEENLADVNEASAEEDETPPR